MAIFRSLFWAGIVSILIIQYRRRVTVGNFKFRIRTVRILRRFRIQPELLTHGQLQFVNNFENDKTWDRTPRKFHTVGKFAMIFGLIIYCLGMFWETADSVKPGLFDMFGVQVMNAYIYLGLFLALFGIIFSQIGYSMQIKILRKALGK